ncbi:MAG: UvrD-helicase domain-containing protein [Bacteroidales bacterium]|nr:UvrD-helicase domain-containing protein [Bacteroidales bacterium]
MQASAECILEGLNDSQKEAVKAVDGPVLIVAGAGSGKTRVLTSRVAYLLANGTDPSGILALTFTKKAAAEMKERISLMVGPAKSRKVVMGTFHAIFVRVLREYADFLGYPQAFTIYDTSDSQSAIKACIKELGLDDKIYKPKEVLSRISNAKNSLMTVDAYLRDAGIQQSDLRAKKPKMGILYELYQKKLKMAGVMDFDDILVNMNILLRDNREALEALCKRYSHILVDEYQDTNFAQYLILRKLSSVHHNICVVGDDSQSIYAFRGAKVENILNFKRDYPQCKVFRLERNYRSTRNIVEAANTLIAHNDARIPKHCYSEGEQGDRIRIIQSFSAEEEAVLVVSDLIEKMRLHHAQYSDFAILYRTNAQSRSFEEVLRRRNIPYMIYSGNSFFDRAEVRDLMAYLKLAVNPNDDESFKRAVSKPSRGIGDTTLNTLGAAAHGAATSLFKAAYLDGTGLKEATLSKLRNFTNSINSWAVAVNGTDAFILAKRIADESGLYAMYKSDTSIEGLARTANLDELLNSISQYVEEKQQEYENDAAETAVVTLGDYLENVSLLSNADTGEGEDNSNKVSLMTVHSAKGLEYPYVAVVGMEDNLFPSMTMTLSRQDLEEERRLFYVAITRAQKTVTLSFANSRMRNGKHESNPPSRFISEIDPRYLENPLSESEKHTFVPNYGCSSKVTFIKKERPLSPSVPPSEIPGFIPDPPEMIKTGCRVEHSRFGKGLVLSLFGTAPEVKAEIMFDEFGQKTILLKYAKLRLERK